MPSPHRNFYKTHGRAFFKVLTLAFLTYQLVYYVWLVLEAEDVQDQAGREIKGLEGEIRLLAENSDIHTAGRAGRDKEAG